MIQVEELVEHDSLLACQRFEERVRRRSEKIYSTRKSCSAASPVALSLVVQEARRARFELVRHQRT